MVGKLVTGDGKMDNQKSSERVPQESESATRSGFNAPYFDLAASVAVASAIYEKGGGICDDDQLAAWLGYKSVRSGTFLTRVSAANKHFGLIQSDGERFSVTERAKKILAPVMPSDATNAKIEAFLNVPLFSKVYEQYRGSTLPPEVGLKNLFKTQYKLLPDRIAQAVRVFLNSAEQAGFFSTTGDRTRMVRPSVTESPNVSDSTKAEKHTSPEKPKSGGSGEGPPGGIHTAIVGVLRELPPPGSPFSAAKKQRFLDALKAVLDWVYPDPEDS